MNKIATHNSATGEKGYGFISWLITPFARTQSKSIDEQYQAGCRSFDIRVRYTDKRGWVCAHGPWETKREATEILKQLNDYPEHVQVCVTYEGTTTNKDLFDNYASYLRKYYTNIIWGAFCTKYADKVEISKVAYITVQNGDKEYEGGVQGFLPLDGHSWHTYLPIPWLWDRIYKRPHQFNENQFTYVDFL